MGREGHLEAISGGRRDFFSPYKWIGVYGKIMFLALQMDRCIRKDHVFKYPPSDRVYGHEIYYT